MRLLYRASVALLATALVLFSFGCDPETGGGGGGVTLPPEINLNSGAGLVSFNQELPLSTTSFIVNLTGDDGDALLRDLAIRENGLVIPSNRLNFRTGQTSNNPILLPSGDQGGFTYEIEIAPDVASAGDVTYEFRLTDVDGEVATTTVTITYVANGPSISLLADPTAVSGDTTITSVNTGFQVFLQLDQGEAFLNTLEVLADGVALPIEQLTLNNQPFPANPVSFADNVSNATVNVGLSPVGVANTAPVFTFRVTDDNGLSNEVSITVTYDTPATDLSFNMTGVFFNASGSSDGGLDLDTGTATTFNSVEAEIQDEGIDLNSSGENWRTQVSSVNDAVLRIADLSTLGDGITYDDVLLTSQISQAFDSGTTPDGNDNFPDADGDTSASEIVTRPLLEGDVLVIRRGERTYLVRIDAINFAPGSNDDSYTVSIKY